MIGKEALLQKALLQYIDIQYPRVEAVASMAGERRGWNAQRLAKALGLKKGVSDLTLYGPDRAVLFLELKKPGEKPTKEQMSFLWRMADRGHSATWCDNIDSAINIVDQWAKKK